MALSGASQPLPGLRLPASASLSLASCWPLPQQLLPVSAAGGGRRRCPKGGALGFAGCQSLSLWERWHCEAMTERARMLMARQLRGDSIALTKGLLIAVSAILPQRPCPLSHLRCQLPQRGSHWRVGQAHAGRAKLVFIVNSSALLQRAAASGQYPLSSCCESLSQGTIFYAILSFQRPAESGPACQRLPLWGSCHRR